MEIVTDFIFLGSKITADFDYSHNIRRHSILGRKAKSNIDSKLKSRDLTLLTKVHLVKAMVFPLVMYGCELDHKESWGPNNWCFQTVVMEKTLESPLDCKEIEPVNRKGNQPWIFTGRTDVEAEAPVGHLKLLWLPDAESWLIGWMASSTQWTQDWAYSMRWWRTGKPGVLQSMALQRVGHDWATEQQ